MLFPLEFNILHHDNVTCVRATCDGDESWMSWHLPHPMIMILGIAFNLYHPSTYLSIWIFMFASNALFTWYIMAFWMEGIQLLACGQYFGREEVNDRWKASLSSQKTLNKQDEVTGPTAGPALMTMAPLIGLQLTRLRPAAPIRSHPFHPFLSECNMSLFHQVIFTEDCLLILDGEQFPFIALAKELG